jgi:polyhydroxyalkanoate synthesis repressor PhaR
VPPTIIKKYGNRRLYDTGDSKYITLDELATKVRGGTDVRVVDAQTHEDLTQATLAQIILESSTAKLLPAPLLAQLIRLGDDGVAEFFGRYVTSALEIYLQTRRGVQTLTQANPLAQLWSASPFGAYAPQFGYGGYGTSRASEPIRSPAPPPHPDEVEPSDAAGDRRRDEELAALRRELEELKVGLGKPGAKRKRR